MTPEEIVLPLIEQQSKREDDDSYTPNPNNAQILTYDMWLKRQTKQFDTPQNLAEYLIHDDAPEKFKQAFMANFIQHPSASWKHKSWGIAKRMTKTKCATLLTQCKYIYLRDSDPELSQTRAVAILAGKEYKDESAIRGRLGLKK